MIGWNGQQMNFNNQHTTSNARTLVRKASLTWHCPLDLLKCSSYYTTQPQYFYCKECGKHFMQHKLSILLSNCIYLMSYGVFFQPISSSILLLNSSFVAHYISPLHDHTISTYVHCMSDNEHWMNIFLNTKIWERWGNTWIGQCEKPMPCEDIMLQF